MRKKLLKKNKPLYLTLISIIFVIALLSFAQAGFWSSIMEFFGFGTSSELVANSLIIQPKGQGEITPNTNLEYEWKVHKIEDNTEPYISDTKSKTPLICEIDLSATKTSDVKDKNIYTKEDKSVKVSTDKITKKLVKDFEKYGLCYQIQDGETFIQIGDNSTVISYVPVGTALYTVNTTYEYFNKTTVDPYNYNSNFVHLNIDNTSSIMNGLLAYYTFDMDSGHKSSYPAFDSSGNNQDGYYTATYDTLITDNGKYGRAFEKHGVANYMKLKSDSLPSKFLDNLTVSVWVYENDQYTGANTFMFGKECCSGGLYFWHGSGAGEGILGYNANGTLEYRGWNMSALTNKKWGHFVVTFQRVNSTHTNVSGYLNGVYNGSTVSVGTVSKQLVDLRIGGGDTDLFNGSLDDFMVWNRALSSSEISQIYNNQAQKYVSEGTITFQSQNIAIRDMFLNVSFQNYIRPTGTNISARVGYANPVSDGYYRDNDNTSSLAYGLVGHWAGDGNANDDLGINNGTLIGGALANGTGKFNSSFVFNGGSSYVGFGGTENTSLSSYTNYTLSLWINANSVQPNWAGLYTKFSGASNHHVLQFNTVGDLIVQHGGSSWDTLIDKPDLTGGMHSVIINYNGIRAYSYLDGIKKQDSAYTTNPTTGNASFRIGMERTTIAFNGSIDDVAIYNRSFSSDEILQLYNKGLTKFTYTDWQNLTDLAGTTTPNYTAYDTSTFAWMDGLSPYKGAITLTRGGDANWTFQTEVSKRNWTAKFDGVETGTKDYMYANTGWTGASLPASQTYSVWFYLTGWSSTPRLVDNGYGWSEIVINSGGSGSSQFPRIYGSSGGGGGCNTQANYYSLSAGRWYHTVMTIENTTNQLKLYVDGVKVANCTMGTYNPGNGGITWGSFSSGTGGAFGGQLDEMALWNRSLTDSEILNLYESTKAQFSKNTFNITNTTTNIIVEAKLISDINKTLTPLIHTNSTIILNAFGADDPPYFLGNSPYNDTYQNNTAYSQQINATDERGVSNYSLNDTTYYIVNNTTGLITNGTLVPAGIYWLNITIMDTTGNINSSVFYINALNSEYPFFSNLTTTPSNNSEYSLTQTYIFNSTIINTNGSAFIDFNGTNYSLTNYAGSNWNYSVYSLPAGTYPYYYWANSSGGQFNQTSTYYYYVKKANNTINLSSNATWTITYGTVTNLSASANGTVNLFRNGTSITNPSIVNLSAGTYNISANTTGNLNYTANSTSQILTVNKASSLIYAYINNSRANYSSIVKNNASNVYLNASLITGVGNIDLLLNGTVIATGSSPLFNLTNLTEGVYNLTARYNTTENYSASSETWWINITLIKPTINLDLIYPLTNINATLNQFFNVTLNVTCLGNNCGDINVSLDPLKATGTVYTSMYGYFDTATDLTGVVTGDYVAWQDGDLSGTCTALIYDAWQCSWNGCDYWYTSISDIGFIYGGESFEIYSTEEECLASFSGGSSGKGLINTTIGATPFYTNMSSNPYTISLTENQSQLVTFWVNATNYTGNITLDTYQFFAYVNLTSDTTVSNITNIWNVTIVNESAGDTTPPTYSNNSTNNTLISQSTNFSILWNDETALHPNGYYIFSTNNTGVWTNDSAINFTTTSSWANVVKTLNDTSGISVGYRWYAKDNAGNENASEIFTLTTTTLNVGIDRLYPPEIQSELNVTKYEFFNVSINVTCLVGNCQNISVSLHERARCNPDTALCTDACSEYLGFDAYGWYSFADGCLNDNGPDSAQLIVYKGASCSLVGGNSSKPCFVYNDWLMSGDIYSCPSYERKGWAVNSSDCVCQDNGGGCTYDWNDLVDFTSERYSGNTTIPQNSSYHPFYTNESNPRIINLNEGQSQEVKFWINASVNWSSFDMWAYANITETPYLSNLTSSWIVNLVDAVAPDTTPPYFTYIPENATIYYLETLGVNFTGTDTESLPVSYSVNDTNFEINSTGYLTNIVTLGIGNYTLNITLNDSVGNQNSTIYNVEVIPAISEVQLFLNGARANNIIDITETLPLSGYLTIGEFGTLNMTLDGVEINSSSSENLTYLFDPLGLGVYTVNLSYYGNSNYTNSSESWTITVTDASIPNVNITYPLVFQYYPSLTLDLNYTLDEPVPDKCWYSLDSGATNSSTVTAGENWTGIVGVEGENTWTVYCNDTGGKEGYDAATFYIDTTPPIITYAPNNISDYYPSQIEVNFTAVDYGIGVETFFINDTTNFQINSTGYLTNLTILGIGNYSINVSVNDSLGNTNYTIFNVESIPSLDNCSVLFNETSPLDYPNTFLVWSDCTSNFTLYRNETPIDNNSVQSLEIGTYNFTVIRTDQTNYSIFNDTEFFVVQSGDSTPPYFTYIPSNETITYLQTWNGADFNANDTQHLPVLFSINWTTLFEINSTGYLINTSELSAGTYEIIVYINDSYVISNQNNTTFKLVVNQKSPTSGMNIGGDSSYEYNKDRTSNITYSETNYGDNDCSYNLNPSNSILSAGSHLFNYSTAGCTNYTSGYVTRTLTISKNSSYCDEMIASPAWNVGISTETNVSGGNCYAGLTCYLSRGGSIVSNPDVQTLAEGSYNYTYGIVNSTQNYSAICDSNTLKIGIHVLTQEITRYCRYKKFGYYDLTLAWYRETNCV